MILTFFFLGSLYRCIRQEILKGDFAENVRLLQVKKPYLNRGDWNFFSDDRSSIWYINI